jgi:putative sigma-54 modulation protein
MDIEYTGRHMEIHPKLRAAAERRLRKLDRVLRGVTHVHVVMAAERHHVLAEVTVRSRNLDLSAVEESADGEVALTTVIDKLIRQAERHVGKVRTRKRVTARRSRRAALWSGVLAPTPGGEGDGESHRVVRSRRLLPKPMTVDEAILELERRNEDLLIYTDSVTLKTHVLHRRRDGRLGIIEPEI